MSFKTQLDKALKQLPRLTNRRGASSRVAPETKPGEWAPLAECAAKFRAMVLEETDDSMVELFALKRCIQQLLALLSAHSQRTKSNAVNVFALKPLVDTLVLVSKDTRNKKHLVSLKALETVAATWDLVGTLPNDIDAAHVGSKVALFVEDMLDCQASACVSTFGARFQDAIVQHRTHLSYVACSTLLVLLEQDSTTPPKRGSRRRSKQSAPDLYQTVVEALPKIGKHLGSHAKTFQEQGMLLELAYRVIQHVRTAPSRRKRLIRAFTSGGIGIPAAFDAYNDAMVLQPDVPLSFLQRSRAFLSSVNTSLGPKSKVASFALAEVVTVDGRRVSEQLDVGSQLFLDSGSDEWSVVALSPLSDDTSSRMTQETLVSGKLSTLLRVAMNSVRQTLALTVSNGVVELRFPADSTGFAQFLQVLKSRVGATVPIRHDNQPEVQPSAAATVIPAARKVSQASTLPFLALNTAEQVQFEQDADYFMSNPLSASHVDHLREADARLKSELATISASKASGSRLRGRRLARRQRAPGRLKLRLEVLNTTEMTPKPNAAPAPSQFDMAAPSPMEIAIKTPTPTRKRPRSPAAKQQAPKKQKPEPTQRPRRAPGRQRVAQLARAAEPEPHVSATDSSSDSETSDDSSSEEESDSEDEQPTQPNRAESLGSLHSLLHSSPRRSKRHPPVASTWAALSNKRAAPSPTTVPSDDDGDQSSMQAMKRQLEALQQRQHDRMMRKTGRLATRAFHRYASWMEQRLVKITESMGAGRAKQMTEMTELQGTLLAKQNSLQDEFDVFIAECEEAERECKQAEGALKRLETMTGAEGVAGLRSLLQSAVGIIDSGVHQSFAELSQQLAPAS